MTGSGEDRGFSYFIEEPKEVQGLLDASNKLFPDNPAR